MGEFQELGHIPGLDISAVSADLYGSGRDDLALFYFKKGAKYAAVYTKSRITSASINWNLGIRKQMVKALLVNTQNANTFTGFKGAEGLKEIAGVLAKELTMKSSQDPEGIKEIIKKTDILKKFVNILGTLLLNCNVPILED